MHLVLARRISCTHFYGLAPTSIHGAMRGQDAVLVCACLRLHCCLAARLLVPALVAAAVSVPAAAASVDSVTNPSSVATAPTSQDERHRPIYHLTPHVGHNNDPNGMFYDPLHGRYHIWCQWRSAVASGTSAWYHFSSADLVKWRRSPYQDVAGCSGGALIAPDSTPTLIICGGAIAVPVNRSDPLLERWVQTGGDLTSKAYFPPDVPGKWDCSATREKSGRYRVTFGSCSMLPAGRMRPNQTNGYCDGSRQDGEPARARLSTLGGRHELRMNLFAIRICLLCFLTSQCGRILVIFFRFMDRTNHHSTCLSGLWPSLG